MAESRTTTVVGVVGLLLTAIGLWFTYSDSKRKTDESRPALDITQARVIERSYLTGARPGQFSVTETWDQEVDTLQFTLHNAGKGEASEVIVEPSQSGDLRQPPRTSQATSVLPDGVLNASFSARAEPIENETKSEFCPEGICVHHKIRFRGRLNYSDRLSGESYSEDWCFTSWAFEPTKDFRVGTAQTPISIAIAPCPR